MPSSVRAEPAAALPLAADVPATRVATGRASARGGAGRLDGLDGLRGLALLMVMFSHLNLLGIGWIGMQSFFVLSGFLITRILLNDRDRASGLGDFFGKFYMRRVLRVFPVYYGYLLGLTLLALLLPRLEAVREELPFAYAYVYNFHMLFEHHRTWTLSHLWSMSVEEQFYLVWPWLIAFLPRRLFPLLCLALIVAAPALREWMQSSVLEQFALDPKVQPAMRTYVVTTSYLDAFAAGALLNFIDWKPRPWMLPALVAVMLALGFAINGTDGMRYLVFGWPQSMPRAYQYAWGYTLVNLFLFVLIGGILAGGAIKRFFCNPVLNYLGERSYPTYVLHFPLLAATVPFWQGLQEALGRVGGTLVFAVPFLLLALTAGALMHRYVEKPANALKDRFRASRKDPARSRVPA